MPRDFLSNFGVVVQILKSVECASQSSPTRSRVNSLIMLLIDVDIESSSLAKPAEKPGFNLSEILVLVYLSAMISFLLSSPRMQFSHDS